MTKEESLYPERIVQDPEIMVGKPVIRGTRIPVERIIAHLATTPNFDDLFAAYPRLTIEDVQAALAYAHDAMETRHKRARRKSPVGSVPVPA
ncbi:MAG: DUF433 domain-containing protein [Thermomicrobiales bacterium]